MVNELLGDRLGGRWPESVRLDEDDVRIDTQQLLHGKARERLVDITSGELLGVHSGASQRIYGRRAHRVGPDIDIGPVHHHDGPLCRNSRDILLEPGYESLHCLFGLVFHSEKDSDLLDMGEHPVDADRVDDEQRCDALEAGAQAVVDPAEPDNNVGVRYCDVFQTRLEERAANGSDFGLVGSPVGGIPVEQVIGSHRLDAEHEHRVDAEPSEADNPDRRVLQHDQLTGSVLDSKGPVLMVVVGVIIVVLILVIVVGVIIVVLILMVVVGVIIVVHILMVVVGVIIVVLILMVVVGVIIVGVIVLILMVVIVVVLILMVVVGVIVVVLILMVVVGVIVSSSS